MPKPVSWSRAPHTPRFVENLLEITEHCKVWNCSFLVDPFRWVEAIALKLLKHRNGGSVLENSVCSEMVHDSPDAAGRGIAILVRVVAQQTFPSYPIYAQSRMHSRGCAGRHVQSDGWGLITTHCCPQFWRSKKNSNSTQFVELYFGVSEQKKPLQPIGQAAEFKFESKFEPLQVIWQSLPKAVPEDNRRFRGQNQWPSSWGRAPAGRTGEHKHRAFPSLRQSLRAATGSLEENVLPLLRYRLSSRVKKVLMLCRYRAVTTDFFSLEMECPLESAGSCCQPKPRPSLRSVLRSFIGL